MGYRDSVGTRNEQQPTGTIGHHPAGDQHRSPKELLLPIEGEGLGVVRNALGRSRAPQHSPASAPIRAPSLLHLHKGLVVGSAGSGVISWLQSVEQGGESLPLE